MADLELVGLHADGEHLVLIGPDGHRHRIAIDDALRAAVRHDRPRLEQVRAASLVRPREIQTRIRAGESPADIARDAGVPVDQIRRYEGPVTAERNWVAQQARLLPLGHEAGAPRLGDLVVDRLAHRGIDPAELSWTAVRRPGEGWELVVEFRAGDRERQARWSVDIPTRALRALDDESRSLSEAELGSSDPRRHLSSVQSRVYDVEVDTEPKAHPSDPAPHWASSRSRRTERPADSHGLAGRDRKGTRTEQEHAGRERGNREEAESERGNRQEAESERGDLRQPEAGRFDAGRFEAGQPDAGPSEAGQSDAGPSEAGPAAAAPSEAAPFRAVQHQPDADTGAPPQTDTSAQHPPDDENATNPAAASQPPVRGEGPHHEADLRTAELLEGLRASRGVRQEIGRLEEELDDEGPWGGPPPTPAAPAQERPPATVRQLRPTPVSAPEPEPEPEEPARQVATPPAAPSATQSRTAGSTPPESGAAQPGPAESPDPAAAHPVAGQPAEAQPAEPGSQARPPVSRPAGTRRVAPPAAAGPATRTPPGTAPAGDIAVPDQHAEPSPQPSKARPRPAPFTSDAGDDQETAQLLPVLPPGEPARRAKSKSRRTSVPSWDEIVFGSKPE